MDDPDPDEESVVSAGSDVVVEEAGSVVLVEEAGSDVVEASLDEASVVAVESEDG